MKKRIITVMLFIAMLTGCTGTSAPVSSATEDSAPETTVTESSTPETTVTENSAPETTVTESSTPETTTTESSAPETTATENSAPETTTTENSTPETTATKQTTTQKTTVTTTQTTNVTTTKATTTKATTTPTPLPAKPEVEETESFTMRLEAEDGRLNGGLFVSEKGGCSGGKMVENFGGDGDSIVMVVDIPTSGMYDFTLSSAGIGSDKVNTLLVDGEQVGYFDSTNGTFSEYVIPSVMLSKGRHEIGIGKSWGWIQLDYVEVKNGKGISNDVYNVTAELANSNATKRTKELYSYLRDCYGKCILSGQVCDKGYYGAEFTAINKVTGKYPAILGLDMMDYTPSRTALGARSDDVEMAIEFSKKGGIVNFCWHWNSPTEYLKSGTSDNGSPRWWGGFNTSNTNFDIEKVMNGKDPAGKAAIDRDIEEIARQLKRLEEADVPVLWRPLHEGSGGWFWWGAKGPDAYKKLWVYLYEKLTYEYGCNNLIWVYNGQAADWYPGDKYVDIVGEDIYAGERSYSPQTSKFSEAVQYSGENKIVALTENGCLFDIEQAVLSNTMWAWFNTWCGDFVVNGTTYSERFTDKAMLKKVYDSEYVITLDELPW